jgi:hypothetical protein
MAGLVIPLVAERRDVTHLIFLAAMLPQPGLSLAEQYEREPDAVGHAQAAFALDERGRLVMASELAQGIFFHDCDADLAEWAAGLLVPQDLTVVTEPSSVNAWPPTARCSYVACIEDRAVPLAWARRAARERLGVTPMELPGGHSPFLSRPRQLVDAIVELIG